MIQRHFKLALTAGHSLPLVINANQYDSGEQWLFTLYNDGVKYTPSTGAIVGIKADRLGIINTGTVDANGRVVINETRQMTAAVGKNIFELLIDDQTHGTANFMVLVEPRPGDNADLSESDYSLFEEAIQGTSQAAIKAGVQEWMDENLTDPTDPIVDASLSLSGAAADAKKTGDEISSLKSAINSKKGLTTYQKELIITILRNAMYNVNQKANIDALEESFVQNVSYITATIDVGSNTIYADDSLDVLRQYLTVTAFYEDGTSELVNGYALSGAFTVGTSTITIAYYNAETTVTVNVSPAVVRYSVTNNLTGVTNSNTVESIASGNAYIGKLTAITSGYMPSGVTITVGGTDVTSNVYNAETYEINIPNVSGDIVITATSAVIPPTPVYRGRNLVFDGTANTVIDTGLTLCDTDKDVTIIVEIDTPTGSSVTNGSQLFNCCLGSTGTDGYLIVRSNGTNIDANVFGVASGIGWSDVFNGLDGQTQVITIRHRANSGTCETRMKIYQNNAISVSDASQSITFTTHTNTAIIGARRWNGVNGFITGTVKLVEIFEQYLNDDQLASYYG